MSTRRYAFENVRIRPSSIKTLFEILAYHPWPTVIPNVRRIETYGAPGTMFRGGLFLDAISCHLTHFTLQDAAVVSFELLITTLHNMSQLQSIALLSIILPSLSKTLHYAGQFLPSTVRRFRIWDTPLYPFLAWLSAHPDIPPLTHLDLGQLDDSQIQMSDKVLFRLAPSLLHIIVSFGHDAMGHTCYGDNTVLDLRTPVRQCIAIKVAPTYNSMRFQQVFGIPPCAIVALMPNLSIIHIESFVGLYEALSTAADAPAVFAARLLASVPGMHVKRVILGLGIPSAAQLCRYNINWPFFDEVLTSDCYKTLESVEFRHAGQVNLDNIANYISTRLPLVASKNLLCFRNVALNLADIHTI